MIRVDYLKNYPEHLKTVVDWAYEQWWAQKHTIDKVENWFKTLLNDDKLPTALIAFIGEQPAGTAFLFAHSPHLGLDASPWFEGLLVKSKIRKTEIKLALYNKVECVAKEMNYENVYLASNLEKFHLKLGYKTMFFLDNGDLLFTKELL